MKNPLIEEECRVYGMFKYSFGYKHLGLFMSEMMQNSVIVFKIQYCIWTKLVKVMKFQLSYFKFQRMMLLKCCTQYASKFGKFSSGHRIGQDQFSFQSQRRALQKNVQTTTELHSFHMLTKWYSKFSKAGLKRMWTKKFQMFKLDLEKAEEPEIKLPTFVGS